uniref:YadA-like family protein n=1 Tax=uncultured Sneathia sp. TaxID=278067 RepID=UPI002598BA7A
MGQNNSVTESSYALVNGEENNVSKSSYSLMNGYKNKAENSANSNVMGKNNSVTESSYALVNGEGNNVSKSGYSLMNGYKNNVEKSMVSSVMGQFNDVKESNYSLVSGYKNKAEKSASSNVMGQNNSVTESSYALVNGEGNNVSKSGYSFVNGAESVVSNSEYGVALGYKAKVIDSNHSLAMGSWSETRKIDGVGYLTNQSVSNIYSFSVGGVDGNNIVRRRIQYLADGSKDDEAVTVAQLRRVEESNPFEYTLKNDVNVKVYFRENKFYKEEKGKLIPIKDDEEVMIRAKTKLKLGNIESSMKKTTNTNNTKPSSSTNTNSNDDNSNVAIVSDLNAVKSDVEKNKTDISKINKEVEGNKTEINKIKKDMKDIDEKSTLALSGVSNAIAMANLPQVMGDKKFNLAASYGYYGGSHAIAVGFSGTNDKQNFIYKLSGSVNNKGNLAFGIGAGIMLGEVNNKDKKIENLEKTNKELLERVAKLEKLLSK